MIYTENLKETFDERKRLAKEISEKFNGSVSMDIWWVEKGSPSLECYFDETFSAPYLLKKVKEAQGKYDAIVIDCFFEPAIEAAREISNVPVLGPNHSACLLAYQLSPSFAIISPDRSARRILMELARKYGYHEKLVSIRYLDTSVLSIEENLGELERKALEESEKAIEEGADCIVIGCTGLSVLAEKLEKGLREKGYEVPVIEPLRAAVFNAIFWASLGVCHSKHSYFVPFEKEREVDWRW